MLALANLGRVVPVAGMAFLGHLPRHVEQKVKADLSFRNPDYDQKSRKNKLDTNTPEYIFAWRETIDGLFVPRYYRSPLIDNLGLRFHVPTAAGDFEHVMHTQPKTAMPDQRPVCAMMDYYEVGDLGFELPCGFGKSYLGSRRAARRRGRFMIVAPTQVKFDEWVNEVAFHLGLPVSKVGRIQGNKLDWFDKPVTVAMLKTIATKALPPAVYNGFQSVLWDEVHLCSAPVMSHGLGLFNGEQVPLSATPGDGVRRKLIELHCGSRWIRAAKDARKVTAHFIPVSVRDTSGRLERADWNMQKVLLAKNSYYVGVARRFTERAINDGRRTMVLSNQVEPLQEISRAFKTPGFVMGGDSLEFLADEAFPQLRSFLDSFEGGSRKVRTQGYIDWVKQHANPILGIGLTSTQPAGFGMDVGNLDGGVILFPVGKPLMVRQILGRWERNHPTKKDPELVILVPNTRKGMDIGRQMAAVMQSEGATVHWHDPHG